jgi:hypothetical protein
MVDWVKVEGPGWESCEEGDRDANESSRLSRSEIFRPDF